MIPALWVQDNPIFQLFQPASTTENSIWKGEGKNEVNSFQISPSPFHSPALRKPDLAAKIVALKVKHRIPTSPIDDI